LRDTAPGDHSGLLVLFFVETSEMGEEVSQHGERGNPVIMSDRSDSRQRANEDEWKPHWRFRVGDRVRVTSKTKPFKGATGIIRAVEQEGWRLAPSFLYRVELAVGLVGYEFGELERISSANP
jgi:transcription antitermination factor NusG